MYEEEGFCMYNVGLPPYLGSIHRGGIAGSIYEEERPCISNVGLPSM